MNHPVVLNSNIKLDIKVSRHIIIIYIYSFAESTEFCRKYVIILLIIGVRIIKNNMSSIRVHILRFLQDKGWNLPLILL